MNKLHTYKLQILNFYTFRHWAETEYDWYIFSTTGPHYNILQEFNLNKMGFILLKYNVTSAFGPMLAVGWLAK